MARAKVPGIEEDVNSGGICEDMKIIHISFGGPEHDIQIGGKIYRFEMHPYSGPIALGKRGKPLAIQPRAFLRAVSLWAQQGQQIDDETGLCEWYHPPKEVLKHIGGRHWKIIGYEQARRGE